MPTKILKAPTQVFLAEKGAWLAHWAQWSGFECLLCAPCRPDGQQRQQKRKKLIRVGKKWSGIHKQSTCMMSNNGQFIGSKSVKNYLHLQIKQQRNRTKNPLKNQEICATKGMETRYNSIKWWLHCALCLWNLNNIFLAFFKVWSTEVETPWWNDHAATIHIPRLLFFIKMFPITYFSKEI